MAITQDDIRRRLRGEEPDYAAAAAALGQAATPALLELATDADPHLVARVVSLAGTIGGECARLVLERTRGHGAAVVRAQVAAAARHLPVDASVPVVLPLLQDEDVSVRKFALAAATQVPRDAAPPVLVAALERVERDDPQPFLRERAARGPRRP